jgi:hypothetical protein
VPFLRSSVACALWDATVAAVVYLAILPVLALVLWDPWPLLGYVIDVPVLLVPVLAGALPRREGIRAVASLPAFIVLRWLNTLYFLEAAWSELVRRQPLLVYEKGH